MDSELRALVVGSGFEPLKAKPADLQSAPIGHSGNPPKTSPLYILDLTKLIPKEQNGLAVMR